MSTLEEALGEVKPQTETVVNVEPEKVEPEPEKGAAEEVKAESTEPVESPSTEPKEPATVPAAVMHAERERRQKLAEELKAYKESHPDQPKKDFFEDPDGAFQDHERKLTQGLTETLLNEGKAEAYAKYDRELVDKAEEWFVTEAQKSPTLASQLNGVSLLHQHRKVVDLYKADQVRKEMAEDPAALEARLKAKGVEEYLAKMKADEEKKAALQSSIPKTLVGDSSKGGIKGTEWTGPTPLTSVIGRGG